MPKTLKFQIIPIHSISRRLRLWFFSEIREKNRRRNIQLEKLWHIHMVAASVELDTPVHNRTESFGIYETEHITSHT